MRFVLSAFHSFLQVQLYFCSNSGIVLSHSLQRQESRVLCLAWHKSGEHIITGGSDSTVRVIHVPSATCRNRITLDGYKERTCTIWDVKFISDSLFISANSSGKVQIWDFYTNTLQSVFNQHTADVLTLTVHERGDTDCVYASGVDSVILQLSRVPSSKTQAKWIPSGRIRPHQHDVFSMHISPTGILASGGAEGDLVITNTRSFNKSGFVKYQPFTCIQRHIKLGNSGDILLFQDISAIRLWHMSPAVSSKIPGVSGHCKKGNAINNAPTLPECDLDSKKSAPTCLLELRSKPPHNLLSSAISPDASKIAVSDSFEVWVYSFIEFECQLSLVSNFAQPSSFMLFTPNQQKLLLATTTEGLKSVTCEGIVVNNISNLAIKQFEISADGQYIAALAKHWKIHVFDLRNGTNVAKVPTMPTLPIVMAFNPLTPELVVFSGGECRQVFVYSLQDHTFECLGQLRKEFKNCHFQGCKTLSHPLSILPIMSERNLFSIYDNDCVMLLRLNDKCAQSTLPGAERKKERSLSSQPIKTASEVVFVGIHSSKKKKPTMILVERSHRALLETLPPPLYRKRFGA